MIAAEIEVGTGDSGGAVLVHGLPAGVASRSFDGLLGFTPLAEGLAQLGLDLCTTPDCKCRAGMTAMSADARPRQDKPKMPKPVRIRAHFSSWQLDAESKREAQTLRAAEAIDGFRVDGEGHVIVAGDLDADLESASMQFWTGRQSLDGLSTCYRDAFEAAGDGDGDTFVASNRLVADHDWPFRRIDHILVRCGQHGGPTLEIRSCCRVFAEPVDGVWASDHFGVLADLAVPGRRPGHPAPRCLDV
jgi:hypothetical protein